MKFNNNHIAKMTMQKKYIIWILLIGLLFTSNKGKGQESMALYYLENVPQSNLLNPAITPRCNGYFGVPGVNTLYMNIKTDLSHRAFLQESDSGPISLTSKYFDYAKFNRKMGKSFNIRNHAMLAHISIGFRTWLLHLCYVAKVKDECHVSNRFF
jgi:hypothetical protein